MGEQNDFETIKFLIENLSSIKSSLNSIEKDTSRKALNIQNISEQLVIIIDALRKSNDNNSRTTETVSHKMEALVRAIDELKSRLDISEARNEFMSENLTTISQMIGEINLKTEVSSDALANIEKYVVDSKEILIEFKTKNAIKDARRDVARKESVFSHAIGVLKSLDNVYKTILALALLVALIATISMKGSLVEFFTAIIKGLL